MTKIYLIVGQTETTKFISSACTSKKVAETLCEFKNLQNEVEKKECRYIYQEVKILWDSIDLQWLNDQITELRMKELPY